MMVDQGNTASGGMEPFARLSATGPTQAARRYGAPPIAVPGSSLAVIPPRGGQLLRDLRRPGTPATRKARASMQGRVVPWCLCLPAVTRSRPTNRTRPANLEARPPRVGEALAESLVGG